MANPLQWVCATRVRRIRRLLSVPYGVGFFRQSQQKWCLLLRYRPLLRKWISKLGMWLLPSNIGHDRLLCKVKHKHLNEKIWQKFALLGESLQTWHFNLFMGRQCKEILPAALQFVQLRISPYSITVLTIMFMEPSRMLEDRTAQLAPHSIILGHPPSQGNRLR